jgi:acyl-CoA synthetase (AMP-forming)/AMP-acid ligase II
MIGSHALFATSELTDQGKGICVGKPIQSVSVDIIAVTDAVQPEWAKVNKLSANQIGEIVVSGPMISQAYYQRQHATDLAKINDGDRVIHRMGDVGYIDDHGLLWMCGRKGHIVDATRGKQRLKRFYTLPCERVFNTHPQVKRSAIVGVDVNGDMVPVLCVELRKGIVCSTSKVLYQELMALAQQYPHTEGIGRFLIHPDFPVDVRHNAKIFREKLAIWAQKQWKE